jgi:hypothetical protein
MSLSEYNTRVNEFVGILKSSPTMVATLWNTLWNTLDDERDDLDAADVTDIINDGGIDIITKKQMEAKLLENGWDAADVADTMQQDLVAMDDSYRRTFLLNIMDPNNPVVVNLCEFEAFAEKCGDAAYEWDGVLTWKALQEFAPVFLAAGHIVVTQDAEVMSFPLPTLPTGGRRKTRRARKAKKSTSRKAKNRR